MSESQLSSVRRIEFTVDWPPGHVACYLVDADEPILVDAGMPTNFASGGTTPEETLHEALDTADYEVADVEHLVLTHPHVDHVGQVRTVIEEATPTVYVPAGVQERFSRAPDALAERVRTNARAAGISGDQLEEAVEMAVESLERDSTLLPPEEVDIWVEGGTTVEVGSLAVETIHAPGHQADLLCYEAEIDSERVLFSGDMALEPFRAVLMHDGLDDGFVEAFPAFFEALDRLADRDPDRVYPGHGPVHTSFHEVLERDRESLDRQLDRVHEQLGEGLRTVPEIALALAGDRSVRYLIPETMSAVAHLVEEGRATVTEEDGVHYYDPA